MNNPTLLIDRLSGMREVELSLATDCDCRPEDTQNWKNAQTLAEAIEAIAAALPEPSRSQKLRAAGFTRRPSPPGKMAGGLWKDPEGLPEPEPFVVKHYSEDEGPSIKGNGFDGLRIGEDRDEAEMFVAWINARIGVRSAPAEPLTPQRWREICNAAGSETDALDEEAQSTPAVLNPGKSDK